MTKRIFNYIYLVILIVPIVQFYLRLIPEAALHNVPVDKRPPQVSVSSFLNGKLQSSLERWLIQGTNLFGGMVHLQNSLNYHLLGAAASDPTKGSLVGKDMALFDRIYINDINGRYESTPLEPQVIAERLKRMQDFLQKNGKKFLFVIHPNKALFNPEWVPDSFKIGAPRPRFIDSLRPELKKYGVNYLEVGEKLDRSGSYFPKSGAHLNYYGMCAATREVALALNSSGRFQYPEFDCVTSGEKRPPRDNELDLTDLLNIWDSSASEAAVPDFKLEIRKSVSPKLKVLFSGTSYVFGLMNVFDDVPAFAETNFIFYDKSLYSYKADSPRENRRVPHPVNPRKHLSLEYLLRHDVIIFESTDARVHQVGGKILYKFKDNERIERFYARKQKN
jgi:hypothetical protein